VLGGHSQGLWNFKGLLIGLRTQLEELREVSRESVAACGECDDPVESIVLEAKTRSVLTDKVLGQLVEILDQYIALYC